MLRGEDFVEDLPPKLRVFIKQPTEEPEDLLTEELDDEQHSDQLISQLKSKT